jgi:hypothetical protein
LVLGTRPDDLDSIHPSERLDGRRPVEASVALSPRSAGVGQQPTSVRLPALDASGDAGSAGCSASRLAWKCRLANTGAPARTECGTSQQGGST